MGKFSKSEPAPKKGWVEKAEENTKEDKDEISLPHKNPRRKGRGLQWLKDNPELQSDNLHFCCLVLGRDGQGKSGICLDYLTDDDIRDGKKAVIIDLDGGCVPLLQIHHKSRVEAQGKQLNEVFLVRNPLQLKETEVGMEPDYQATFNNIHEVLEDVREFAKEENIKYIVLDGLSTALKHAERLMRIEKNLDADGGVQMRYWLVRNQIFEEVLEQIKALPMSKFYIGHDDFIVLDEHDENVSSIKRKTNAMAHQKIRCLRKVDKDHTTFEIVVDKNKFNTGSEGTRVEFCRVDNQTRTVEKWDTTEVFKVLSGAE